MLFAYRDPGIEYWRRRELEKMRRGIRTYHPTTAQFRHLLPPMDPAIIPRLKANAKLGLNYFEMQALKDDENVSTD